MHVRVQGLNGLAAGFAFAECVWTIMHHTVEVIGNAKEVAVVVHFKVALLPLWRGWKRNKFLATLVALHFTPVSKSLGHSFGLA